MYEYSGHARLSVCLSLAAFQHYCTDPDVTLENGRQCPLVVHYWADLQSVHGFRCYDNIAPNAKFSECSVLALCLVLEVRQSFQNCQVSPSDLSLGLHVCANRTSHYVKTYTHARLDNTHKPNFSVITCVLRNQRTQHSIKYGN